MSKVIEADPKGQKQRPTSDALESTADLVGERLIEQAVTDYLLQLRKVWDEAQERSAEAYAKYLGEVEEIYRNAGKRYEELYRYYLNSVEKVVAAEDPQSIAEAEDKELVRKGNQVWTPADDLKLFEAASRYMNALQEAWSAENSRGRFEEAYRGYLLAVQKGWNAIDAKAISPTNLAAIGQSIQTAASWAGCTVRQVS